jgi:hypothetical protein
MKTKSILILLTSLFSLAAHAEAELTLNGYLIGKKGVTFFYSGCVGHPLRQSDLQVDRTAAGDSERPVTELRLFAAHGDPACQSRKYGPASLGYSFKQLGLAKGDEFVIASEIQRTAGN